jgi:hypothetical protein
VKENKEVLETKFEQSFTELLLTPFGMSLDLLHEKLGETLVRHHKEGKLLATKLNEDDLDEKLGLDESASIRVWSAYQHTKLLYEPENFTENHNGKTKQEIIAQGGTWQISFLENLPNLPAEGKGETKANRKQLEANQTPGQYLKILQTKNYKNESGITPEDWATYFLTHLEKTNQVIDDWKKNGKFSLNLGAFFPDSSQVPDACWYRDIRRVRVGGNFPDEFDSNEGARSRVRI